ncbi:hypothetical protein [Tahibacter aquaticus]|uniref:hypothetical protein n=1 Tax=Tahibacter aquaticus TaxID=520092 RepID=UPI001AAD0ACE|nr:hypothetical protein [Tahibacter aquaticus]
MLSVQTPNRLRSPRLALASLLLWLPFAIAQAAGWQASISPGDALYPVLDLSQGVSKPGEGRYGDGSGMISVDIVASQDNERVDLRVSAPALAQAATVQAVLPRAGQHYTLKPRLRWDRGALARVDKPQDIAVDFRLQRNGGDVQTRRQAARLHPLSEALYYVRDGKDHVDLGWIFAAYADPNSPVIDRILDEVAERHPFVSLQPGPRSSAQTLAAAYAVWEVLQLHGVRYADEDPGLARGPLVWSQHVRLHDDVWNERRANCIDGSLLLAAALERLGIRSVLLLVPRHALLAFYTDARQSAPTFVETTLLGARQLAVRPRPGFVGELSLIDSDALDSFSAALVAGQARYAREAAGFGQRKPDFQWIDLATARSYGIVPLAAPAAAAPPRR